MSATDDDSNSKSQAPNPKQNPMTETSMLETLLSMLPAPFYGRRLGMVWNIEILNIRICLRFVA
jgi:hypothetical protein